MKTKQTLQPISSLSLILVQFFCWAISSVCFKQVRIRSDLNICLPHPTKKTRRIRWNRMIKLENIGQIEYNTDKKIQRCPFDGVLIELCDVFVFVTLVFCLMMKRSGAIDINGRAFCSIITTYYEWIGLVSLELSKPMIIKETLWRFIL